MSITSTAHLIFRRCQWRGVASPLIYQNSESRPPDPFALTRSYSLVLRVVLFLTPSTFSSAANPAIAGAAGASVLATAGPFFSVLTGVLIVVVLTYRVSLYFQSHVDKRPAGLTIVGLGPTRPKIAASIPSSVKAAAARPAATSGICLIAWRTSNPHRSG